MTTKNDFADEEWQQLLQAPVAAGIYIMAADPSFVVGSMKEAIAVSGSILKKGKENNGELLASLLAEFREREMVREAQLKFEKKDLDSVRQTALNALTVAVQVVDQKAAPEESAEMKQWLYDVSCQTADAAKEGGFLGFGGQRVSEEEKAALQKVAALLGVRG